MNYAELLRGAQTRLVTARDALTAKMADRAKFTEEHPDDDVSALDTEVDTLLDQVEKESVEVKRLDRLEKAFAARSQPIGQPGLGHNGGPILIPPRQSEFKPSADLFIRGALCAAEAFYTHRDPMDIAATRYKDDEVTAFFVGLTTKAAQPPATTFTPTYAAELVRQTYRAWMDTLAMVAVVPRLPFRPENFDDGSPIIYPSRAPKGAFPANFEALWRKEGDPIRVGVLSLASQTMRPYSAGVIGHFTKELFKRSTPNIETVIREAIVDDTAEMLDGYFFSASAAVVDVRPPGIANGVVAPNSTASTGNANLEVEADLNRMIAGLLVTRRLGRSPVWVMNPVNAAAVGTATNAFGVPQYPGMANIGAATATLKGFPAYMSPSIPDDMVFLLDAAAIAFAGGTPAWEVSDQATIHEETATPLPIVTPGPAIATPVRSLFQTHSAAVKAVYELSWLALRVGAVQILTGVAWKTGITPSPIVTVPAAGALEAPPAARESGNGRRGEPDRGPDNRR